MAGVTVPISYPTNTVDLAKSIELLKSARSNSDQLISSTKKLGTETVTAGKQVTSTLEGMNIKLQQLKGQIENTSQANTARLQKLSAEYKALQAEIDKANKSLFEQQRAATSAAEGWQTMVSTVKTFIAYQIAKEVVNISISLATMRGNLEGVSKAFNQIPNATLLLQNLRRATHGTVDDLNLMQQALRAQNYKIPLQNMGTLLEFAATKAQQTGQEVQHLIDYLVSGIGLRSIKRLDDLGFTANRVKEALGGVSLQAASMGQLMTAVTKLMNEDLQKTGGYLETAKTTVEQLNTNITTLQQTIAKKLDTSGLVGFLRDAVKGLDLFIQAGGDPALAKIFLIQEKAIAQAAKEVENFTQKKEAELKTEEQIKKAIDEEIKSTQALIQKQKELAEQFRSKKKEETFSNSSVLARVAGLKDQKTVNDGIEKEAAAMEQRNLVLQNYIALLQKYTPVKREANVVEDEGAEERIKASQEIIESEFRRAQAARKAAIDTEIELDKLGRAYERINDIRKETIQIEEDEKEIVPEILTEWQKFFRLFQNELGQGQKDLTPERLAKMTKNTLIDIGSDQLLAAANREVQVYDIRIKNAQNYYDRLIDLAGDNERRKKELEVKRDAELKKLEKGREEAETRAARRRIIIEGAVAIAKTFAQYGFTPAALIAAGLMAAQTISQLAILAKAPKGYKKGVIGLKGPGNETSDSIPTMLSLNESVMTAQATRDSYKTLHKIQAGKLNDKVLDKILAGNVTVVGSDDAMVAKKIDELIKATKSNRPPDIVERYGMIYMAQKKGENSTKYIKSKYHK